MRPLGDRVLIRPEAPAEQTESGLHLVEHAKPATAGTVVSVGTGPHPLRAQALTTAHFLRSMNVGNKAPVSVLDEAAELLEEATARTPEVKAGDYVLFSWQSGQELWIDDERLIIMRESDILAVVED